AGRTRHRARARARLAAVVGAGARRERRGAAVVRAARLRGGTEPAARLRPPRPPRAPAAFGHGRPARDRAVSEASAVPSRDPVAIRLYRPGDEQAIVSTYNKIFPVPRDLRHSYWKFRDNPTGHTQIVVAIESETGTVVGQHPAHPLATWLEGRRSLTAQIVDLLVLPQWRTHGGRPGLFAQVGRAWIDHFIGEREGQDVFAFGWPVPAWRAGRKYLGYLNVRDWDILFREMHEAGPRARPEGLSVEEVPRFGADVDALWERMTGELRLAVVRDARSLNWRYADHPDVHY